jgi:hypothetical protein
MGNQFWHIKPDSQRRLAEWDHGKIKTESVICPVNDGHRRGGRRLTDLSIVLPDGAVEDFVWTWQGELLLQNGTLRLLHEFGLSGFETKPVSAKFKKSTQKPPKLWELVLIGWAGMANPASGISLDPEKSCAVCGLLHYTNLRNPGYLIDESRWDGSDFFMVWPLPKFIFVTEKVIQIAKEHHLTGLRHEKVSEMETGDSGFGPGKLSYSMPDKRARELGEPLGIY